MNENIRKGNSVLLFLLMFLRPPRLIGYGATKRSVSNIICVLVCVQFQPLYISFRMKIIRYLCKIYNICSSHGDGVLSVVHNGNVTNVKAMIINTFLYQTIYIFSFFLQIFNTCLLLNSMQKNLLLTYFVSHFQSVFLFSGKFCGGIWGGKLSPTRYPR